MLGVFLFGLLQKSIATFFAHFSKPPFLSDLCFLHRRRLLSEASPLLRRPHRRILLPRPGFLLPLKSSHRGFSPPIVIRTAPSSFRRNSTAPLPFAACTGKGVEPPSFLSHFWCSFWSIGS